MSFTIILLTCHIKVLDVTSGFRAVNKDCIKIFAHSYAQDYPEPEAIVKAYKSKMRLKEVPVVMNERQGGSSSINGFKTIYYMLKVSIAIIVSRLFG